jgi:hypothetical protein
VSNEPRERWYVLPVLALACVVGWAFVGLLVGVTAAVGWWAYRFATGAARFDSVTPQDVVVAALAVIAACYWLGYHVEKHTTRHERRRRQDAEDGLWLAVADRDFYLTRVAELEKQVEGFKRIGNEVQP